MCLPTYLYLGLNRDHVTNAMESVVDVVLVVNFQSFLSEECTAAGMWVFHAVRQVYA
jgi:hypothetical protein